MRNSVRAGLALLVVTALALAGIYGWQQRDPDMAVQQVAADRGPVVSSLQVTGVVRADRHVALSSRVAGTVALAAAREGDAVQAGELLLQLDDAEARLLVRSRSLALAEAAQQLQQARRQLRMQRAEHADGGIGRQVLQDAEDRVKLAELAQDKAQVALESARQDLVHQQLHAPMAGVVTARAVEPGEFVQPGRMLFELAGPEQAILLKVEPVDASALRTGMPVRVSLEGLDRPPVQEHIRRIEPAIRREGNSDYLPVWVTVTDRTLPLRLNQQVQVDIDMATHNASVRLPLDALVTRGGRHYVWRLRAGRLALDEVRLGALGDRYVEIRLGIAAGDAVVLPGGQALQPGQKAHVSGLRKADSPGP